MFQYDYEITDNLLTIPNDAPPIKRQYAFASLEELNFRELNLDEEIVFRGLDPLPELPELNELPELPELNEENELQITNEIQQTDEITSHIINLDNINEDYFSIPILEQESLQNGD